jgi:O-antigen ligase
LFPKTLNRFRELGYSTFNYTSTARESHFNSELTASQWNGANIRLAIWESSAPVIRRHWLRGVGIGDKMDSLLAQYKAVGFDFGVKSRRNMHNTYLDLLFTMGVIGLVLFLIAFAFYPLAQAWKYQDGWIAAVVICFLFALFPETYLDRTVGNTWLSFFAALIVARTAAYKEQLPQ